MLERICAPSHKTTQNNQNQRGFEMNTYDFEIPVPCPVCLESGKDPEDGGKCEECGGRGIVLGIKIA